MNSRALLQQIEQSDIFLSIHTKSYEEDAECLAQQEYARSLHKPIFVVLFPGVPEPDLDGFLAARVFRILDKDKFSEQLPELTRELKRFLIELREDLSHG